MTEIRKLTKNGQIKIPKEFYKSICIEDGDFVFIYKSHGCLIIKKLHQDESVNQCIFRNGKLSIPIELRNLLNITSASLLKIEAFPDDGYLTISRIDTLEHLNYYN